MFPGPVSQRSRNFSGLFRVPQFPLYQGRNEVYFFITDPVFFTEILIPDPKHIENFDPSSRKNLLSLIPDPDIMGCGPRSRSCDP